MNLQQRNYKNPLYAVYLGMKKRCYTPSCKGYKNYGGKGVKVCKEWKSDFSVFYEWAIENGYSYEPGISRSQRLSLDRIDSNGDYSPQNCRWLPLEENVRRASKGRIVTAETRVKQSKAMKGRVFTGEHKRKLSENSKGKNKGNIYSKKGYYKMFDKNNNLIKTFNRPLDIVAFFEPRKISLGNINEAGNKNRKSAYGYKWEYVYEG